VIVDVRHEMTGLSGEAYDELIGAGRKKEKEKKRAKLNKV